MLAKVFFLTFFEVVVQDRQLDMGNLLIRFLVTGLLIGLSASPSLPVCNLEPIHCLIFNAGEQHGCSAFRIRPMPSFDLC